MEQVLAQEKQCLVLVPEIGLTPQTLRRFQNRFPSPIAVLHSGLNMAQRRHAWLAAESGQARIVIGTRSAVFAPLPQLGLIVIDEEHDGSFKQQEGFRYHARDVAVVRARNFNIPIVMGSATPSLESLLNIQRGRYQCLSLPRRAGDAEPPRVRVLDVRGEKIYEGVSSPLLVSMADYLAKDAQVMLFINRRGYAPVLLCHHCGWTSSCRQCDTTMVYYAGIGRLRCHHCGAQRAAETHCPLCRAEDLLPVGYGTQRVENFIKQQFPDVEVIRVDRDSTRRKGALDAVLKKIKAGRRQILIGTQMLAKGHHFPNLQLVAVLDADQGLFSQDFRASERLAQLVVQVAGRAGRGSMPGEVLLQTHAPGHPLLGLLVRRGYGAFAQAALLEREQSAWPPYSFLALLRAEAKDKQRSQFFLNQAKQLLPAGGELSLFGPLPAPMEKRAGMWRGQLLIQAQKRNELQVILDNWVVKISQLPSARSVRWSLDVDPMDLY